MSSVTGDCARAQADGIGDESAGLCVCVCVCAGQGVCWLGCVLVRVYGCMDVMDVCMDVWMYVRVCVYVCMDVWMYACWLG